MLDALQKAGNADFDEFVEIVGGDGEELDALEERITEIARLLKYAAIEIEPLYVTVQVVARVVERGTSQRAARERER